MIQFHFVPMEDLGIDQKQVVPTKRDCWRTWLAATYFADGDVLFAKIHAVGFGSKRVHWSFDQVRRWTKGNNLLLSHAKPFAPKGAARMMASSGTNGSRRSS